MNTRKPCYLFLDYDGTVYINGVVPETTKDALRTVQQAGHRVILNTGRSRGDAPGDDGIRWDGELYGGADYTYRGERQVLGQRSGAPRYAAGKVYASQLGALHHADSRAYQSASI